MPADVDYKNWPGHSEAEIKSSRAEILERLVVAYERGLDEYFEARYSRSKERWGLILNELVDTEAILYNNDSETYYEFLGETVGAVLVHPSSHSRRFSLPKAYRKYVIRRNDATLLIMRGHGTVAPDELHTWQELYFAVLAMAMHRFRKSLRKRLISEMAILEKECPYDFRWALQRIFNDYEKRP